jgi:hypothetical protein
VQLPHSSSDYKELFCSCLNYLPFLTLCCIAHWTTTRSTWLPTPSSFTEAAYVHPHQSSLCPSPSVSSRPEILSSVSLIWSTLQHVQT